jgi:RHS repeat-associated protein
VYPRTAGKVSSVWIVIAVVIVAVLSQTAAASASHTPSASEPPELGSPASTSSGQAEGRGQSSPLTAKVKLRAAALRRLAAAREAMPANALQATATNTATDTPGIDPDAYTCDEPGYINFEGLPDGYDLSASAVGGVQFTTTGGYTWRVGDFSTGSYNGKYPNGAYTSEGSNWAWLGENQGAGRIDFVNGPASRFSLLTSAGTSVQLDAYDAQGDLLTTAGPIGVNTSTGTMDELKITRATPDMAYVIVHDDGNYFLVDSICTNAPGIYTTPIGGAVGDQMAGNPSTSLVQCEYGAYPVNCATGDFWHTFSDVSIPGRGLPLAVTRTYNSAMAADDSPFGYGWSSNITMSATVDGSGDVTIDQENGSTDTFAPDGSGGYTAPSSVLASLTQEPDGSYTFIRRQRESFVFSSTGRLLRESDRNGNTTTFAYNGSEQLVAEADPSGRTVAFTYGPAGRIATATDPEGRESSYAYDDAGDLTDVVDPLGRHWQFTYDSAHRMITMRQPRYFGDTTTVPSPVVTNTYDGSGRIVAQSDPLGRVTTFDYVSQPGSTVITNPKGVATVETYVNGELASLAKGAGTPSVATWQYTYDPATLGLTRTVDPDGNVTSNSYDDRGNLLTTTDALGNRTSYTYSDLDEVESETDPRGTATTYSYDGAGNLLEKAASLTETGEVARTSYRYEGAPGEVTAITDPDGNTTEYSYDGAGDLTSVDGPDGRETTHAYDTDSQLVSTVTPAGNESGASSAAHTTTYAHNADGELTGETDRLGHATTYGYDSDGNHTTTTDPNGRTTHRVYDADNELVEVVRPDGSALKTTWDAAGNMTAQIDAAGHATTYDYDALDRVVSSTDPDGHTTSYGYDGAGNRTSMTDAEGQLTRFEYDADGELVSIFYSDGITPSVFEEYDPDGNRTVMSDGTGTSTFSYDSLNRMTSATDGAGATVGYEYDLAGHLTQLTYPNGQSVTRAYDPAGHLASVTDWLGHTTHFSYDTDSNLSEEVYGNGVTAHLGYDNADRRTSIVDSKGATQLAGFSYTRDPVGQVTNEVSQNGATSETNFSRNSLDQLTAANSAPYDYDAADNPTTFGAAAQHFDPANELTSASGPGEGEESKSPMPGGGSGPAGESSTSAKSGPTPPPASPSKRPLHCHGGFKKEKIHGKSKCVKMKKKRHGHPKRRVAVRSQADPAVYSGAGRTVSGQFDGANRPRFDINVDSPVGTAQASLTEVTRHFAYNLRGDRIMEEPTAGGIRALTYDQADRLTGMGSDVSYAYNGDGLRTSKTVSGVTTNEVWNEAEDLPEPLEAGSTNYVYGPGGQPIEQITGGVATFMQSDQQGSVRLLTDASGAVIGRYDYDPWGNVTEHTGAGATDLQFDGQLTDAETGYQYLRTRSYDPSTGQFLSPDPLVPLLRQRYTYGLNDPLTFGDPSGLAACDSTGAYCLSYRTILTCPAGGGQCIVAPPDPCSGVRVGPGYILAPNGDPILDLPSPPQTHSGSGNSKFVPDGPVPFSQDPLTKSIFQISPFPLTDL